MVRAPRDSVFVGSVVAFCTWLSPLSTASLGPLVVIIFKNKGLVIFKKSKKLVFKNAP